MIGIKGKERPLEVRFWEKVEKTSGCWNWIGAIDSVGYGSLRQGGKTYRSHRLSFELANGPIPLGMCVLHRCDNRRCVNPAHLFLGTKQDNSQDMVSKGRNLPNQKHGEEIHGSKLTEAQVLEIRKCYASGESTRKIAKNYPISYSVVWRIATSKKWRHLP